MAAAENGAGVVAGILRVTDGAGAWVGGTLGAVTGASIAASTGPYYDGAYDGGGYYDPAAPVCGGPVGPVPVYYPAAYAGNRGSYGGDRGYTGGSPAYRGGQAGGARAYNQLPQSRPASSTAAPRMYSVNGQRPAARGPGYRQAYRGGGGGSAGGDRGRGGNRGSGPNRAGR